MTKTKRLSIIGGGIGGLTLAIALRKKGYEPTVYESAPALKPLGAGLGLAANAIKAFDEIGISDDVLQAGKILKKFTLRDQRGNTLSVADAESLSGRYGVPSNFTIHRADLHEVLLSKLPPHSVVLGKTCVRFDQRASGVVLHFSDGSAIETDYVMACDGVHSVFRKQLVPNSLPRYAGYTCWRAVIDTLPPSLDGEATGESWGIGRRFGIVPLSNHRVYWFATLNAPANDLSKKAYTVADLQKVFGEFHSPVPEVLAHTKNEQLIWNDIVDIKPLRQFAFGNIVLMGDAAHATTPNMGQGACMAIEDAVILAQCIAQNAEPIVAFQRFEARRLNRTRHIIVDSRRIGRVGQWENRFLINVRNTALRLTSERVAAQQFKFISDVSFQ
ncbi:FAD-dependent monooxygenase [Chryseolinea lacunae]|uniref:FAD-dependent monooxygenase n=1 Tax=Chryseolinea lacunae TaxID=2801331 RepID=A0ABS1KTL5_9BACT|nr:FAD-dependent monooxygenase [Chryseolinea lacunae]MBL0742607.1 FAD-dependent monooxygenase [Chryseolinea lacunae]